MKSYLKRAWGRDWASVAVSEDTIVEARRGAYDENKAILDKIKEKMKNEDGYTEAERIAMFNLLGRHFHFCMEDIVDGKIAARIINAENVGSTEA